MTVQIRLNFACTILALEFSQVYRKTISLAEKVVGGIWLVKRFTDDDDTSSCLTFDEMKREVNYRKHSPHVKKKYFVHELNSQLQNTMSKKTQQPKMVMEINLKQRPIVIISRLIKTHTLAFVNICLLFHPFIYSIVCVCNALMFL